jgi:prepilin-type N-terminal cleavage/methylation domain-containing protein
VRTKTHKAFTLIELLVVIGLLGVFAVVAYPNVSKWINDREVKAEAYKAAGFLREMESLVASGKFGMVQVVLKDNVEVYTMSNENFKNIYKGFSNNIYKRTNRCNFGTSQPGSSRNNNLATVSFPQSGSDHVVFISPSQTVLCMTKDGLLNYSGARTTERDTETSKYVDVFTICSKSNTTQRTCTYNTRQDNMYKVTIDKFANTKIYKLMNKSTWKKIDG